MAVPKTTVVNDDEGEVYFPLSAPPARMKPETRAMANNLPADFRPARNSFASSGLLPESSVYQHPRYSQPRVIQETPSRPPSVYWSDDATSNADTSTIRSLGSITSWGTKGLRAFKRASIPNPSAFTFYREGTPPPQEADEQAEEDGTGRKDCQQRQSGWSGEREGCVASTSSKDPLREERRTTADFEFVNGRYVPPGLRDGRKPGRIPPGSMALSGLEKQDMCLSPVQGSSRRDVETATSDGASSYLRRRRARHWCVVLSLLLAMILVGVGVGLGVGLTVGKGRA